MTSRKNRTKPVANQTLLRKCPVCGSDSIKKHGPYKEGHRYYCKSGKHTFTHRLPGITRRRRLPSDFFAYGSLMEQGMSVRTAAKTSGVSHATSYRWRREWLERFPELKDFVPKAKYIRPKRSTMDKTDELGREV